MPYPPGHDHMTTSPLRSDRLGEFPPTFLVGGEYEVLIDDITLLAQRMSQQGGRVKLFTKPGMPHAYWMLILDSPEGEEVVTLLADFVSTL